MTCPRCRNTGYVRDRIWCDCAARPYERGPKPEPHQISDEEMEFLLRLRGVAFRGSNATPEPYEPEAPAPPLEPVDKVASLIERAKRMGRAS